MGKDFKKFEQSELNKQNDSKVHKDLDPNIHLSEGVYEELKKQREYVQSAQLLAETLIYPLTAPLTTIYVSLQLSVKAHRNMHGQQNIREQTKELIEQQKQLTIQDRRKYELLIQSGQNQNTQPYTAPVYSSYKEVIQGLNKQGGVFGFYKGGLLGMIHKVINQHLRIQLFDSFHTEQYRLYKSNNFIITFVAYTTQMLLIDMLTYPLMTLQSRFIIQNRKKEFRVQKKIESTFTKSIQRPRLLYNGFSFTIPQNILFALSSNFMINKNSDKRLGYILSAQFSNLVTYPLTTCMRRMQCQGRQAGLIPLRYKGPWHCMKLTLQEEGVKGLYRGFMLSSLQQLLLSYFVLNYTIGAQKQFDLMHI